MKLMLLFGLLITGLCGVANCADPWKLPDVERHKWAGRVEKVTRRPGWTVEAKGNDIIVRRQKAVAMARPSINSINGKPNSAGEGTVEFVLKFSPKMSMDEYERLAAINTTSDKEYDRLHRAVGLTHKFDDFVANSAEELQRVRAFREAVAKLPRHELPDLYTPDHSIHLQRRPNGMYPAEKAIQDECQVIEDALKKYFGMYQP